MVPTDVYVDLFSNSSLETFPKNTVSSFKVKLSRPLELTGDYECALAQVICPSASATDVDTRGEILIITHPENLEQKTYALVKEKTFPFNNETVLNNSFKPKPDHPINLSTTSYYPEVGYTSNKYYAYKHIFPEAQIFPNGQAVVTHLNDLFSTSPPSDLFGRIVKQRMIPSAQDDNEKYPVRFSIATDGSLQVKIRDIDFGIAISGAIARILGFGVADDQYVIFDLPGEYKFQHKVNLNAARPSLMSFYTNIILPHWVGDTTAPLIRVCRVPTIKEGDSSSSFISFDFDTLHYLPVALKYIQEIEVEVRGPQGDLIPFQYGICYVRFHFRPVKNVT